MDKPQIPIPQEPTNDPRQPSVAAEQELEARREEAFHHADDGDELPFDVPRD